LRKPDRSALAEFAKYAKERWKVEVRTSASRPNPGRLRRIVEWKGREADILLGGESALYDKLAERAPRQARLPKSAVDRSDSIGSPSTIPLKDPKGYWIGTVSALRAGVPPKLLARLGVPEPKDWDDLLHPN